jgi:hypothetical protein
MNTQQDKGKKECFGLQVMGTLNQKTISEQLDKVQCKFHQNKLHGVNGSTCRQT